MPIKQCKNLLFWNFSLTLLHSEWPKLYGVLAILIAIGLKSQSLPERSYPNSDGDKHTNHRAAAAEIVHIHLHKLAHGKVPNETDEAELLYLVLYCLQLFPFYLAAERFKSLFILSVSRFLSVKMNDL